MKLTIQRTSSVFCVVTALVTVGKTQWGMAGSNQHALHQHYAVCCYSSSHSVKDTVGDDQEQSTVHFTNSVLCGWDDCIFEEKTAKNKKNSLYQEFKV